MNDKEIYAVLFQYDIYPEKVEAYSEKVWKVYSNVGIFALKKTSLPSEKKELLVQNYRKLERLGYRYIVPIFPTTFGEYIVTTSNGDYYVMPWLEETRYERKVTKEELMMTQLGVIHRLTSKVEDVSKRVVEESYEALKRSWEKRALDLERFANIAEKKVYMSPFELTFLTHFHYLQTKVEEAKLHLEKWYEHSSEKEKYRTVLCHGNLSRPHAIFTNERMPYLLNFERSSVDTPARDLALFCRQSFRYYLWEEEEMLSWFTAYARHFLLQEEEIELLLAFLSFPEPILFSVQRYAENKWKWTELQHVHQLEEKIMMMRLVQRLQNYFNPQG